MKAVDPNDLGLELALQIAGTISNEDNPPLLVGFAAVYLPQPCLSEEVEGVEVHHYHFCRLITAVVVLYGLWRRLLKLLAEDPQKSSILAQIQPQATEVLKWACHMLEGLASAVMVLLDGVYMAQRAEEAAVNEKLAASAFESFVEELDLSGLGEG